MQESVDIAAKWTEENYMKLNKDKSKEMIISFAKDGNFWNTIPNIKIDGIDVEQVDHAKHNIYIQFPMTCLGISM